MLRLLVKKQLAEVFRMYFYDAKNNRKRSTGGIILFFGLFIIIMVGFLGSVFFRTSKTFSVCCEVKLIPVEMESSLALVSPRLLERFKMRAMIRNAIAVPKAQPPMMAMINAGISMFITPVSS